MYVIKCYREEEFIMKKFAKYMEITAATLLAVAPIAAPVINANTEVTVEATAADDYKAEHATEIQNWVNELNNTVQLTPNNPELAEDEVTTLFIYGTYYFILSPQDLTPQSGFKSALGVQNDVFSHFNNNTKNDNLFFNDDNVMTLATATSNDGGIQGNLVPKDVNNLLEQGKSITFHIMLKYATSDERTNEPSSITDDQGTISTGGSDTEPWIKGVTLATKDVVVLPVNYNKNKDEKAPGTSYSGTFSPSVDAKTYNDNGNTTSAILSKASAWKIDRQMNINGETYYRVATNEWIKKSDGIEVIPAQRVVSSNKVAGLYTSKGNKVTNRALAADSLWYSDRTATINGQTMYRVATDEWISARDTK